MTDQEAAELIASHKGWAKRAKEHWVWAVGDMAWYVDLNFVISVNDKEKLQLAQIYETFLYLEMDTDHFDVAGWYPKVDCIPVPREDQLMDMLEAKIEVKEGYLIKYFDTNDKYWKISFHYENRGKNKNVLPIIGDFVSAPTRLLALFAAVCKVYGLNGKAK